MRREYEMTEEQYAMLLEACKPIPCMMVRGYPPQSPQENANAAWATLGRELGFRSLTVKPIPGKSTRCFTAEPVETEGAAIE